MWRARAPYVAAAAVLVIVLAVCALWASLAQTLVTPACDLPTPPPNVNFLICPSATATPGPS